MPSSVRHRNDAVQQREAAVSGTLRTLTRNSPAKATGAHISIVGHITRDELRQQLAEVDMANGLANRFLWLCVRRSKCLPEGGALHEVDFAPIVAKFTSAWTSPEASAKYAATMKLAEFGQMSTLD